MIKIIESKDNQKFLVELQKRNQRNTKEIEKIVNAILYEVKTKGDEALKAYTLQFDKVSIEELQVSKEEIQQAFQGIDKALLETIEKSADNIRMYHEKQKRTSSIYNEQSEPIVLGQLIRPINRVGIYVPGGKAVYPSTVLMNAIPAKIAGVHEIIMITPPNKEGKINPNILVAAKIAGVDQIYKVGGAQGIGALAFGTACIKAVDKITGPGNSYVTVAKKQVAGMVGIDMIAGPSEILIIADKTAKPAYIAADMISQAEHDEMAAAILVTNCKNLAEEVIIELEKQVTLSLRRDIIEKSLDHYGAVLLVDNMDQCFEISNQIAPEHLELMVENPFAHYNKVKNAGAIFLGAHTPEPVGDYFAGPNHTLPTSSTARFCSPLSVDDFIKKTSLLYYSREALLLNKDHIIRFAEAEGLSGHANAIKIRFEEERK